ncbi:MAG: tripartite motif-containing protein 71 [Solirubrobacteraceae bacterium]|jgi:DNA-binding beta-propeller fold protein YncE|nr:tripartite motif-containing protein 71 [Solirubrobacteraceae bacterium]
MTRTPRTRPRTRRLLIAAILAALCPAVLPAGAAADCPGASGACPYVAAGQIGQRAEGVLRFPQTVAIGPDGSVYVGDQSSNVVQVFNPDGSFQREVGVAGTRAGELGPVGAVAVAGDNTLLVADGRDRINRFDATGHLLNAFGSTGTDVGQFHFGAGGGNDSPAGGGLAIAGETLFVSDSFNNRVQRFQLDGSNAAELIPPGQLSNPRGLAVNGTRLIVADDHNHRLAVFDTGGRFLSSVGAGQGQGQNQLSFPFGVGLDPQGRVFVADDLNHRVVRFGPKSAYPYKARWGSYGSAPGQLAYPRALAVDSAGQVYVTNTGNDRIDVFDRSGGLLRSFGASGRAAGQFNAPLGVGSDANGFRAVVDSVNGRIELLGADGSIAAVWGSPAPGPTILPNPVAVVFDAIGNAYVLDQRRARIVVFDRASGLPVRTIASQGSGPGQLLDPSALAIDAAGTLSVADTGNERIARFGLDGSYLGATTGVGRTRGIAVTPDGSRTYVSGTNSRVTVYDPAGAVITEFGGVGTKLGKLAAPAQIALDNAGNLWVADRGNSRVQEFGPAGERLGFFGTRGIGAGEFINPTGVNISCTGLLTVSDTKNNRVQQFALAAPQVPPCTALGPIANPPVPRLPVLPLPLGPQVTVRVLRSTHLFGSRVLPLRVGCDTVCTLKATATLTERLKPRTRKKAFSVSLRAVTTKLPAGDTKVVRLAISRTQVKGLRRALKRRKGLTLTLQLVATADAGDPTTVSRQQQATG